MQLEQRLKEQRKDRKRPILLALFGFIFLTVSVFASYLWFGGGTGKGKDGGLGSFFGAPRKVNVLVLGVDERSDDVGRSDTLFLVTLDTGTKEVTMLSIPRDTRVKIQGHGYDKINHAYAFGGHTLSEQSIEDLLGIKIDYYIIVNIKAFMKIIDAVGGVDIDVEKRMHYEDPYDDSLGSKGLVINLKPGQQHMDGDTAIQYVRYRDEEGDIGRVARQQKFVKALLDQVTKPSVITKVPAIIKEVSSAIKTDMSVGEMLNFAKILNDARQKGLNTCMLPGKPAFINDISYWLPDIAEARQIIAKTEGTVTDEKFAGTTKKLASEYEKAIPNEMKIVDPPKSNTKDKEKEKGPNSPTNPEKPDAPGQPRSPNKPNIPPPPERGSERLRVSIINASGSSDAGNRMAALIREQGLDVSSVVFSESVTPSTIVTAHSSNSSVVGKLTGLPFKYALEISNDSTRADRVTVIIGRDFTR